MKDATTLLSFLIAIYNAFSVYAARIARGATKMARYLDTTDMGT